MDSQDKYQVQQSQEARLLLESEFFQVVYQQMQDNLNRLVWQCQSWEEYLRLRDQLRHLEVFRSVLTSYVVRGDEIKELMEMVKAGAFENM